MGRKAESKNLSGLICPPPDLSSGAQIVSFPLYSKNSKKVEIVKACIIPTKAFLWNITFETQLKCSPLVQTMLASQNMKSTGRNKCSHDEVVLMNCRVPEIKISLR